MHPALQLFYNIYIFNTGSLNLNLFDDVISMHNGNMKHAHAIEFDYTNLVLL